MSADETMRSLREALRRAPADAPAKALLAALRATFDLDLVAAVDEWKGSVKKGHAAAK